MKQEKLKILLNKFVNDTEKHDINSLNELVDHIKSGLKENGFSEDSGEEII